MSTKVFLYQYVTGEEEIVWVFAFYSLNSLLSGENSLKQLLLTNNQLVTRLIKFFD